jgi:hypothetical protein
MTKIGPVPLARAYLVLQDTLWNLSATATPDQLICCPLEGHPAVQEGDVQVEHKAQEICAAGSLAKAQGWG